MAKKISKTRKTVLILGGFTLLAITSVAVFYIRFEMVSSQLKSEMGYEGGAANAVKHAYAAAALYKFFGYFTDTSYAEAAVLWLGSLNEHAEKLTKVRHPDTYEEILKDLYNNMVGITAAEWQAHHAVNEPTLEILLKMKQNGALVVSREDNPLYYKSPSTAGDDADAADEWFLSKKEAIRARTQAKLNGFALKNEEKPPF
jgi:hypothetical protein